MEYSGCENLSVYEYIFVVLLTVPSALTKSNTLQ